jgi:hypothetical protein
VPELDTPLAPTMDFVQSLAVNISEINKQMRLQAFTALPQVFIPTMSTAPNPANPFGNNLNQPPTDPVKPPAHAITVRDKWITYILPMLVQVSKNCLA